MATLKKQAILVVSTLLYLKSKSNHFCTFRWCVFHIKYDSWLLSAFIRPYYPLQQGMMKDRERKKEEEEAEKNSTSEILMKRRQVNTYKREERKAKCVCMCDARCDARCEKRLKSQNEG